MGCLHAIGEAGADQRAFQSALAADANLLALELCAVASRCGEEFLTHGIVDHRLLQASTVLERDRYGERREAVQEIRRAVERIDDPDEFAVAAAAAALLGEKGMVGMSCAEWSR